MLAAFLLPPESAMIAHLAFEAPHRSPFVVDLKPRLRHASKWFRFVDPRRLRISLLRSRRFVSSSDSEISWINTFSEFGLTSGLSLLRGMDFLARWFSFQQEYLMHAQIHMRGLDVQDSRLSHAASNPLWIESGMLSGDEM